MGMALLRVDEKPAYKYPGLAITTQPTYRPIR